MDSVFVRRVTTNQQVEFRLDSASAALYGIRDHVGRVISRCPFVPNHACNGNAGPGGVSFSMARAQWRGDDSLILRRLRQTRAIQKSMRTQIGIVGAGPA